MKLIKKLITFALVLVLLVVGALVGVYAYVRSTYQIDLIKTLGQLNTLSKEVDETALCPEAFSSEDMTDVQSIVNSSVQDFITFVEGQGYIVNFDELPENLRTIIKLTGKQVGALVDVVVRQETGGVVSLAGKEIPFALKQVDFSSVTQDGATLNAVVSLDIRGVKEQMRTGFPFDWLKGKIPDFFYVSSSVRIDKGAEPFSYSVSHEGLALNMLSAEDTADLFHTLNLLFELGEAKEVNEKIGSLVAGALIGNETERGLAYSLQRVGATDYAFLLEEGIEYFAVLR